MLASAIKETIAFFRGGTSGFNDPEKLVLDAVVEKLPSNEASILKRQMNAVSLVQRQHPGRLIAAYYSKNSSAPILPYKENEYCIAKVTYELGGKSKITSVVLHNGRLMTLERNIPVKAESLIYIKSVDLHPQGFESVADEIGAKEHG